MFLSSEEGGLSPYGAVAHPIVYPIRKIQPRTAFYVSISRKARREGDRRVNAVIGLAKLCRRMRGRGESREFRLKIECVFVDCVCGCLMILNLEISGFMHEWYCLLL